VPPTYRATFSSHLRNVARARCAISNFARLCGFSHEALYDIQLAAGEALSNAVEHGRGSRSSGFSVCCSFSDGELTIEIRDSGGGFALDGIFDDVPIEERTRGFGIFLMRRLMDGVDFERNGTCVRLIRRQQASSGA